MTSNLPNWNGASIVYARASQICEWLNARRYTEQKAAARGKKFRFMPSYDADLIIKAMAAGDEESLKAMNAQFMHVWVRPRRK
jgi:hypothetical protein